MRRPSPLYLALASLAVRGDTGFAHAAADAHRRIGGRLRVLPRICNPASACDGDGRQRPKEDAPTSPARKSYATMAIQSAVEDGHLSRARRIAYECLLLLHGASDQQYSTAGDMPHEGFDDCCPSTREEVVRVYKHSMDIFFRERGNIYEMIAAHERQGGVDEPSSSVQSDCWDGKESSHAHDATMGQPSFGAVVSGFGDIASDDTSPGSAAMDRWNECCSFFRPNDADPSCFNGGNHRFLCCELAERSDNHLILPALREPMVNILLQFNNNRQAREVVHIEQEGSLRMYDVAGVLWPAGFLLGMCLSDPIECGISEVMDAVNEALGNGQPLAVELGAGAGFPAIAFAKAVQYRKNVCEQSGHSLVVATDISNESLALITSNAHNNGVGHLVAAIEANHSDPNSLSSMSKRVFVSSGDGRIKDGFDVIIGSSLQALFDGTSQEGAALWRSLDALLSRENPNAVVVLSHVRTGDEKISLPPQDSGGKFECIRRISGDRFGMRTRDGHTSDFELVLLQRRLV